MISWTPHGIFGESDQRLSLEKLFLCTGTPKNTQFYVAFNRVFLLHFECVAVHCSELMGVEAEVV